MQYNGIYGSEIFYHAFEVTINVQSAAVQLSAFCYRAVKISVNRVKVHEKLWKNNGKQLAASNELPWKAGKSSARQLVAVAVAVEKPPQDRGGCKVKVFHRKINANEWRHN